MIFKCKKKGHNKKPEELTGQEVAHMIGTTVAFKQKMGECDNYTVAKPMKTDSR